MFVIALLAVASTLLNGLAFAGPVEKRQTHTGDATFYDVGLGACGVFNVPSDFIVAVGHDFFDTFPGATSNPNNNPVCGRTANASYQGRSIQVKIEDRCEACGPNDLDFSTSAFQALIGPLSIGRAHGMTWSLNGGGGGTPPPPPPGCTRTHTAVAGDTCTTIAASAGISVATFESLNPSINSACTNLQIGTAYCIGTGGAPSCPSRYTVVAGDTCDAIDRKFGIALSQFLSMNPSVNSACTNLQIGVSYCV
ncbi:hypothetical protein EXIGLDRAFT_832561 [Exidia glandulosa HHB12029]|uniref:LysM domain-containing protein n=1 Tax=Exidia glandulosa HHB12029 TaxID=1314781 RepID=A0A165LKC1_EXIGL|nr:hypothetical protein EXIGLDRAFT_832561 [Exidia glandulosa HHB12029]